MSRWISNATPAESPDQVQYFDKLTRKAFYRYNIHNSKNTYTLTGVISIGLLSVINHICRQKNQCIEGIN